MKTIAYAIYTVALLLVLVTLLVVFSIYSIIIKIPLTMVIGYNGESPITEGFINGSIFLTEEIMKTITDKLDE